MTRIQDIANDYNSLVTRYNTPTLAYPPALKAFYEKKLDSEDEIVDTEGVLVYDKMRKKYKMAPMRAQTKHFTKNLNKGGRQDIESMKDFTKRIDKKRVSTKIIRPEKKHLGKKCAQKLISCSKSIAKGFRYVFVYLPGVFGNWIQKKTIGLGLAIGFELGKPSSFCLIIR
jgi:hypothetical protein